MNAALTLPPEFITALAGAVADELQRRGALAAPTSPYLTADEAADYLRCSRQALYDRVHQGAIERSAHGLELVLAARAC